MKTSKGTGSKASFNIIRLSLKVSFNNFGFIPIVGFISGGAISKFFISVYFKRGGDICLSGSWFSLGDKVRVVFEAG